MDGPLATRRVFGVKTKDSLRDITHLINAHRHPYVLLALCIAESNLHELSERDRTDLSECDRSGGLVHQSVCWVPYSTASEIPGWDFGGRKTGPWPSHDRNYRALLRYFHSAENALADAGPRIDALVDRWGDPLEALCRWNKNSIPGAQNPNRRNFARGLEEAEEYTHDTDPEEERPMALNVGYGALQKMKENDDHPIRDSEFHRNEDGSIFEKAYGAKAYYHSSNAGGNWENLGPFSYGE